MILTKEGRVLFNDIPAADPFYVQLGAVKYDIVKECDEGFVTRELRAEYSPSIIEPALKIHGIDIDKEIGQALLQEIAFEIKSESLMPENAGRVFYLFCIDVTRMVVDSAIAMKYSLTYKVA